MSWFFQPETVTTEFWGYWRTENCNLHEIVLYTRVLYLKIEIIRTELAVMLLSKRKIYTKKINLKERFYPITLTHAVRPQCLKLFNDLTQKLTRNFCVEVKIRLNF